VSARIRAGSRFKRFLCFVLIDVRCFRVPPGICAAQVEQHSRRAQGILDTKCCVFCFLTASVYTRVYCNNPYTPTCWGQRPCCCYHTATTAGTSSQTSTEFRIIRFHEQAEEALPHAACHNRSPWELDHGAVDQSALWYCSWEVTGWCFGPDTSYGVSLSPADN
jgi:hypothetical protein